ncbi:glycine cleavage system protein H [Hydrogenophaga sp.]|uniref:glycine cleavage system protein H n=1 Tax=Hydrogenophaga sp. TaxID=1904254 RepID=UPI00261730EC|nr:glycine cleavage system protein H [Hydrogenophaga sp.]MCW5653619.1 glycine cleavage system protein H [Hydrogenophaga sp.]
MDRFLADFPAGLLYHVEHQVWARVEAPDVVTVGITALGIKLSGEIYMCRARPLGTVVEQGRSIGVVELAKSIVSVKAPLSGTVIEANPVLAQRPERVHEDPYGEGWIARLRPSALEAERAALLQGEAVFAAMAEHARLHRIQIEHHA